MKKLVLLITLFFTLSMIVGACTKTEEQTGENTSVSETTDNQAVTPTAPATIEPAKEEAPAAEQPAPVAEPASEKPQGDTVGQMIEEGKQMSEQVAEQAGGTIAEQTEGAKDMTEKAVGQAEGMVGHTMNEMENAAESAVKVETPVETPAKTNP